MITTKPRILIVDDEPENLKALERTLRARFEVSAFTDPKTALAAVEQSAYAVVISDQRMPGMLGTDLLAKVAQISPLSTRVILTAFTETKSILDAINRAEIYRYITKPWDNQELLATIQGAAEHHRLRLERQELVRELEQQNERLRQKEEELRRLNQGLEQVVRDRTQQLERANVKLSELAMTDPLTGVLNRRAFFMRFTEEVERSRRYKHSIVVVMIDIDHFKAYNDREGHIAGDEALVCTAQLLAGNLRKTDVLGRYGGEEFIIIMPETSIHNAVEICERLRQAVASSRPAGEGHAGLTLSMGLCCFPQSGLEAEGLVKAADEALYEAKRAGRNRVVVHAPVSASR